MSLVALCVVSTLVITLLMLTHPTFSEEEMQRSSPADLLVRLVGSLLLLVLWFVPLVIVGFRSGWYHPIWLIPVSLAAGLAIYTPYQLTGKQRPNGCWCGVFALLGLVWMFLMAWDTGSFIPSPLPQ